MSGITLSPKQIEARDKIMEFVANDDEKTFTLAGYAGAGKTSLAKKIAADIGEDRVVFCAFTGKAVNVLREKGCSNVTTIHSALYKVAEHDKSKLTQLEADLEAAKAQGAAVSIGALTMEIDRIKNEHKKLKFELGDASSFASAKLVIVDEYSMLDRKIIFDLEATGKKILYMGDPFQLPPVEGECPLQPNFFIEEIHRQALDSSIIRVSKDVREGRGIEFGDQGDFEFMPAYMVRPRDYLGADQVICGRNATRAAINGWFRSQHGNAIYNLPVKGERLICLKNNKSMNLFNGMIGVAENDATKENDYDIRYMLDFEGIKNIAVWDGDIRGRGSDYNWNDFQMRGLNRFDYAYAITCHKSQGSEFGEVLVFNEPVGKDDVMMRRWLYTAITRGKKKVKLVQP